MSQLLQAEPVTVPLSPPPPNRSLTLQFAAIGLVLAVLYASIAHRLFLNWLHDPNFSHGFFVPLFSAFVLWERRQRLARLAWEPAWSGLAVLLLGLAILVAGVTGAELFLSRISFLFVLVGLTALLLGWNHVREALFPILFLVLMIPIPTIIFNQITAPLQTVASIFATHILQLLGVPVLREGNIIALSKMALEVAEACSGIRSLMSLATLAIIYGYLAETRMWIRVTLALASLPIAVVANAFRIVGTGLIVQYGDPEKAQGFFHEFSGWLVFVVSLALLFLLHRVLGWVAGKDELP